MKKKHKILIMIFIITAFIILLIYLLTKNEPCDEQWYLTGDSKYNLDIKAKEMWKYLNKTTNKKKVTVAIIDEGVNINNKQIQKSIWSNSNEIKNNNKDDDNNGFVDDYNGWNFCDNNNDVSDIKNSLSSHGTKIAGVMVADNNKGKITGICSKGLVRIMPIKVISADDDIINVETGSIKNLIKAIKYAENNGAQICNISLNTDKENIELKNVMEKSKMLFVVSSGNGGTRGKNIDKIKSYPASWQLPNMITVCNLKSNGRVNSKSNYGKESVDIGAPGTDIYGLDNYEEYSYGTGSSYAVPVVTGLAAMIYSCNTGITSEKCKEIILSSSKKERGIELKVSKGRVLDCAESIKALVKMGKGD